MATSPAAEEVSSEDEIFFGEITMKEIRARFLPKEKRRELRRANRKKNMERNGSDTSVKIIEIHSEPEMNIDNDWTDSSYGTTTSNRADHKIDAENSYLRLLPDDSFLRIEKLVADCSISDDIFQNHTSEIKLCFKPPSNKLPMIADENVKQVAKIEPNYLFCNNNGLFKLKQDCAQLATIEQNHLFCNNNRDGLFYLEQDCKQVAKIEQHLLFCNNNRDGLFQLEQDCKQEFQEQDDTPPYKQNPPTEDNTNLVKPDVPRQYESATSERTPLKNNNFLEPPVTDVISTPTGNANYIDIFKTPKNTLSQKQQASSVTKSLRKVNAYQHVASPVAKPEVQVQDDTPPHKQNLLTEDNTNQVKPNVPRQHESTKNERTPLKDNNFLEPPITDVISTPRGNANNTNIFKTPKNNTLSKKQQASSVTKSLRKVNAYQHVASPVALYIKRSPQAPLGHCVNLKPRTISYIPQLKMKPVKKINDKENTPMPKIVYRTPKETLVITHDRKKISKDQHNNIEASTSVVIRKHAPSEVKLKESKEIVFKDDTINESLISQPDLSIHIEKTTFY